MLKRLEITSSFQKGQNQNYGISGSGVMSILVGTSENVTIWEHWALKG